jgi:uncharacterized protein (DUF433 family)
MTTKAISEEEKMRRVPGIIFVDGATGRRARIAGTGLDVFEVIGVYWAGDEDLEGLLEGFHWLTGAQILAALRYAREFPEEIEAILREAEALVPDEIRAGYTMRWPSQTR